MVVYLESFPGDSRKMQPALRVFDRSIVPSLKVNQPKCFTLSHTPASPVQSNRDTPGGGS